MQQRAEKLGNVLLIDDSKVDNYINSKVLEMSEKTSSIYTFEDARDALTLLRNNEIRPDIIFLDLYMPSMSGFEFLEEFQELPDQVRAQCQIVLLSSAFETLEVEKLQKFDCIAGCLVKPLTYESLEQKPTNIRNDNGNFSFPYHLFGKDY